jgi:hypothetical protein
MTLTDTMTAFLAEVPAATHARIDEIVAHPAIGGGFDRKFFPGVFARRVSVQRKLENIIAHEARCAAQRGEA